MYNKRIKFIYNKGGIFDVKKVSVKFLKANLCFRQKNKT